MSRSLTFSLLALLFVIPFASAQCPSDQVVAGRQCTVTCGQDRPGGDFAAQYTGSFQGCITACGNNPECLTAQYHEENGYCYLKNSINAAVSSDTTDSVVCGAVVSSSSSSSSSAPSTTLKTACKPKTTATAISTYFEPVTTP